MTVKKSDTGVIVMECDTSVKVLERTVSVCVFVENACCIFLDLPWFSCNIF